MKHEKLYERFITAAERKEDLKTLDAKKLLRLYSDAEISEDTYGMSENDCDIEVSFDNIIHQNEDFDDFDNSHFNVENGKIPANTAYAIAGKFLAKFKAKVLDEELLVYDEALGYFAKMPKFTAYVEIEKLYPKKLKQIAKSSLANEIYVQLLRKANLQIDASKLNAHPHLINCINGVIDVFSGKLLPHSPQYFFTYCIQAEYKANPKTAKAFEHFCETSLNGDKKKRKLLLQIMAYVCSDLPGAKKAFFLAGAPDSGKSVISAFLQSLIGSSHVSNVPLQKLGERFYQACMFGKKLNIQAEIKNSKLTDLSIFKAITGGDGIMAEYKFGTPFFFVPKLKLVFAGNSLPTSSEAEVTKAFLNRLCVLTFDTSIAKKNQDPNLSEKLWAERHDIFTMAINTLSKLYQKNFEFATPDDSTRFINHYAKLSNSLESFINDCCIVSADSSVPVSSFSKAYKNYCVENGFETLNAPEIAQFLYNKYQITKRRIHKTTSNLYHFCGIKLS